MENLRFGCSGADVQQLQRELSEAGSRVPADGVFGRRTETAVRDFQRRHGLLPDGIFGHGTQARLRHAAPATGGRPHQPTPALTDLAQRLGPSIVPPATRALHVPADPGAKQPCKQMTTSDRGLDFIFAEESDRHSGNVSWPRGRSGVTLGPGYDMKERTGPQIEADMRGIGLSAADATTMGTASGMSDAGGSAQSWVGAHPQWPNLSREQQMGLLKLIVPKYEAIVHRNLQADLWQYAFDALVSVAYNPARSMAGLAHMVGAGNYADAAADILSRVGLSVAVMKGLKARREKEVALFLYGDYGKAGA